MGIGGLLIVCGIVCLMIAYYYFKMYQNDRIRHIEITDLDGDQSRKVITEPIIDGIGYPITTYISNKTNYSEYQPISQNGSIVYKSTTEPIVK